MGRNLALAALTLAVLSGGCRKKVEVSVYRAPKDASPQLPAMAAAPAASPGELSWSVPLGWRRVDASGMRYATFKIPGPQSGGAELSVVVLPGDAGGTLANVNRWRGQMSLEPLDDGGLASAATLVKSAAGTLLSVDFKADDGRKRLLGAILTAYDKTWFFKMTGDAASVGAAKPRFHDFLKSLRPASS